ncbi:hypothetical protein QUC31_001733 [Theobroma cacao]
MDEVMTAAGASARFRSASSPTSIVPSNVPLLSAVLAFALARFLNLFTTCYLVPLISGSGSCRVRLRMHCSIPRENFELGFDMENRSY